MPTIDRIGPYRLFFYSNEGSEAAHVHVQRDRSLAKFWLDPVALASSTGFAAHELREVEKLVTARSTILIEAWNEFFGSRT
jgi:hypothetical protein